jgi:hypothetical protein
MGFLSSSSAIDLRPATNANLRCISLSAALAVTFERFLVDDHEELHTERAKKAFKSLHIYSARSLETKHLVRIARRRATDKIDRLATDGQLI